MKKKKKPVKKNPLITDKMKDEEIERVSKLVELEKIEREKIVYEIATIPDFDFW